jgi:hypothetical protein
MAMRKAGLTLKAAVRAPGEVTRDVGVGLKGLGKMVPRRKKR